MEEEGIDDIETGTNIKATLVTTSHDNAGANLMLGMVEAFNTLYPCRICSMELNDTKKATKEDPSLIREDYMSGINQAKEKSAPGDATLRPNWSSGFRKESELNFFKHYKAERGTSVDPFHDLPEGVHRKDLKKVCIHMRDHMGITEDQMRRDIELYDFGTLNHAHKPSNFKLSVDSLGQSGTQIKTLLAHFPLIFGKYFVKKTDLKYLDLLKILIRITNLAFKRVICDEDINNMKSLVEFYLASLLKLFPGTTLSPKHHFLTHYARVMKRLGPISHFSTAACESKHGFFTNLIDKSSLSRNVLKTLAIRHQNVQATNFVSGLKLQVAIGKITDISDEKATELSNKFNVSTSGWKIVSWVNLIFKFAPNYFFRYNDQLYSVKLILKKTDDEFCLVCSEWTYEDDDYECWSELKEPITETLVEFKNVERLQTFNKVLSNKTKGFCVLY